MKLLKSVLTLMMIAVMVTSCDKDETPGVPETYMELDYTEEGCFNYIYKKSTSKGVVSNRTTYKFRWNDDYTADVHVYNAKFSERMPDGVNISFKGLKWEAVDDWKKISVNDIVPTVVTNNGDSVDASAFVLDNLTVNVFDRRLLNFTPEYIPIINVSMTMGDVEVVAVQKRIVYSGVTNVKNVSSGAAFNHNSALYQIVLDESTMQATIDIFGAKFAEKMPAMDMKFAGVAFELSNKGYILECNELIPTIKDVPYPNYKVTNLNGDAMFETGLSLDFDCKETYSVQANLGYPLVL